MELQGFTGNSLALNARKITGVLTGQHYRVRYRARNEVGFGEFSEIGYILAASKPYKPWEIKAEIVDDDLFISWQMPYNGGTPIYQAQIEILEVDGSTYTEDLTNCDGYDDTIFD